MRADPAVRNQPVPASPPPPSPPYFPPCLRACVPLRAAARLLRPRCRAVGPPRRRVCCAPRVGVTRRQASSPGRARVVRVGVACGAGTLGPPSARRPAVVSRSGAGRAARGFVRPAPRGPWRLRPGARCGRCCGVRPPCGASGSSPGGCRRLGGRAAVARRSRYARSVLCSRSAFSRVVQPSGERRDLHVERVVSHATVICSRALP